MAEPLALFDLPASRTRTVRASGTATGQSVTAPLLKWPGGKGGELAQIFEAAPPVFDRYFEPFVGGGAVYWAVPVGVPAYINDTSSDLMSFYEHVQRQDMDFLERLAQIAHWWSALADFTEHHGGHIVALFMAPKGHSKSSVVEEAARAVNSCLAEAVATVPPVWADVADDFKGNVKRLVAKKFARMQHVEIERGQQMSEADVWSNIEGAYKACAYTTLRSSYNKARREQEVSSRQSALFFFLREYAYAAMFRFNGKGEFNVPYGGMTYNRKNLAKKIDHLKSAEVVQRLATTELGSEDFYSFIDRHEPGPGDWMFLDPPYDSEFSDYDRNAFALRDHQRLVEVMKDLSCKFQLVIKATDVVDNIYRDTGWNRIEFDKKYMWTIKERNNRNATHLMITNYSLEH